MSYILFIGYVEAGHVRETISNQVTRRKYLAAVGGVTALSDCSWLDGEADSPDQLVIESNETETETTITYYEKVIWKNTGRLVIQENAGFGLMET